MAAAVGTVGALVNVSTVPPVMVFEAVAQTALAFAAAVGAAVVGMLSIFPPTRSRSARTAATIETSERLVLPMVWHR